MKTSMKWVSAVLLAAGLGLVSSTMANGGGNLAIEVGNQDGSKTLSVSAIKTSVPQLAAASGDCVTNCINDPPLYCEAEGPAVQACCSQACSGQYN